MKKIAIMLIAITSAMAICAQNGAYIEYKISSNKGANGSMKINYSEYGNSSEFSMQIPQMPDGGYVSKSLSNKEKPDMIFMINDKNKTYTESKKSDSQNDDKKTYTVKKIGEETVNGYKCVHALVTEGTETHDVWNTKDVKEFNSYREAYNSNKKMGSEKRDQALKDAGCDGFMVKAVHKGNEREGEVTMELVKLTKKNFSKSDFELPAGYSKAGSGATAAPGQPKTQQEIMNMTPEERNKYIEEMKAKYKQN